MGGSSSRTSSYSSDAGNDTSASLPAVFFDHPDAEMRKVAEEALARVFTFAARDIESVVSLSHVNSRWRSCVQKQQVTREEVVSPAMNLVDLMWRNIVLQSPPATVLRVPSGILRHTPRCQQRSTESTDPYQNSDVRGEGSRGSSQRTTNFTLSQSRFSIDVPKLVAETDNNGTWAPSAQKNKNSDGDCSANDTDEAPDEEVKSGKQIGEDFVKLARHSHALLWVIEKLIYKARIDVNYRSPKTMFTALISAVDAGNVHAVPTIIASGARIDKRGAHGTTALLVACKRGDATLARFLIQHGADPTVHDALGTDCISAAVANDPSGEILELLMATKKIDINAATVSNKRSATIARDPRHHHHCHHRPDAPGSSASVPSMRGSPLLEACRTGANCSAVKLLLRAGADPNVRQPSNGVTALLAAVKNGRTDIARCLVDAGADVNLSSDNAVTPLMAAAVTGDVESARYLISKGAHLNVRDYNGHSAMQLAKNHDCPAVVDLLREKGVLER